MVIYNRPVRLVYVKVMPNSSFVLNHGRSMRNLSRSGAAFIALALALGLRATVAVAETSPWNHSTEFNEASLTTTVGALKLWPRRLALIDHVPAPATTR